MPKRISIWINVHALIPHFLCYVFFLTDVNLLREEEINFMEDLNKRYFGKAIKTMKLFYCLTSVIICERSFQRYVNRPGLFRKKLLIDSVSLFEDVQIYLEENGSNRGYKNVLSRGIQYSKELRGSRNCIKCCQSLMSQIKTTKIS